MDLIPLRVIRVLHEGPGDHDVRADRRNLRVILQARAYFFAPAFCFAHLAFWASEILFRA